jgi:predicted dehydrogenase
MDDSGRRDFLKTATLAATAGLVARCAGTNGTGAVAPATHSTVMDLVVPPLERVRFGLIGVGERGSVHTDLLCRIDGAEIMAICDPHEEVLDRAMGLVEQHGRPAPQRIAGDDHAYRRMLERDDIDAVLIATPWRWHAPMAIDAMEAGKHALVEVPMATTVEDCWKIVDTAERTQRNCMMLENVCYGRQELMLLNMVRAGLFGELVHGEAAYIHELRWQMKEIEHKTGSWRTYWHTQRNGNLYPTHGLGPIAQYMNVNRGDRFDYLTSVSSPALGRAAYAAREFPPEHERNTLNYICGDMNTSLIKTVRGRSIMVQHDTTTPRPYTRHNLIQGTKGAFGGFPGRIALDLEDGSDSFHHWDQDLDAWYARYEHPMWNAIRTQAEEAGGHGGMDFVMLWRLVHCLRNGEPLDQNVYDGAAWTAISPLSADSVADRGNSKTVPDFTRGVWRDAQPLGVVGVDAAPAKA